MEKKLLDRRSFLKTATGTTVAAVAGLTQAGLVLAQETKIPQKFTGTGHAETPGMETRHLGADLEVSAVGLSCPSTIRQASPTPDKNGMLALLQKAYDSGVTLFDLTAASNPYVAEEWIGQALKPVRQKVKISTKFGYATRGRLPLEDSASKQIRKTVEASLRRLGTDYIDLLYQYQTNPNIPIEEVAATVKELIQEGKVLSWGLRDASAETIRRAHMVCPVTAVKCEYSIWAREPERKIFPTLEAYGIGLAPYGTLGYGFFASDKLGRNLPITPVINEWAQKKGMTTGQFALAWLLSRKPWIVPVPGTNNPEHLEDLLRVGTARLALWEIEAFDREVARAV